MIRLDRNEYARNWRAKNKKRLAKEARERRKKWSPERKAAEVHRQRRYQYKAKYGITIEDYEALFVQQGGQCALCPSKPNQRRLAVDHCHDTGRVRGLLCIKCNHALGVLGDTPEGITSALTYLGVNA